MLKWKASVVAGILALMASLCQPPAANAQGCGPQNANCIVPTAPVGTSNNQAASTAFVQNQIGHGIPYADITGLPSMTILGSIGGGAASALTPTQVTTFCNVFTAPLIGCVPAPGTIAGKFLRDDGTWQTVSNFGPQSANFFFAGPTSGSAASPTFRAMVAADMPAPFTNGTATGNTSKFATSTGTLTQNDCIKIDANLNFVDNGAACGAGSNTAATQNFVAGAGFTPGTTTSLTLSSAPTNAQQLLIAFDGVVQSHNTWSLAGAVITFNVAIPANVNVVEAQWYTASTTAGVGSLTDPSSNVASGAVNVASPFAITSNTLYMPACFVPSRAAAVLLNLSNCTAVSTAGYASPGDGGAGYFLKTASNFRDSYTTNASVTSNGGSCTNGTYVGVYFSGGNGVNFQATITVSGGNASLTNILDYGGNAYSVNDVLTAQNGFVVGCQPQVTISAVTTPLASFTDLGSNKWQYTPNNSFINPLAFGCKFNFTQSGGDAGATSDTPCVRDTLAFAAYSNPNNQNFTDQPFASNRVLFPAGTSLLSGTDTAPGTLLATGIVQPTGVIVEGAGPTNTIFKVPNAGITQNFWNLADPNRHAACFGTSLRDVGLTALSSTTRTNNLYLLYSNCAQQTETVRNVQIYDGPFGCYRYDTGYGGAATNSYYNLFCTHQNNNQDAIVINASTTVFEFYTLIVEGASTGTNAFTALNGHIHIVGFHSEGIIVALNVNSPGSLTVEHATGGNGCTNFVTLQSTNTAGNFAIFDAYKNGCSTNLVLDGQPGGSNRSADAIPANGWVSFNP